MATLRSMPDPDDEVEVVDEPEEELGQMAEAASAENHLVLLKALRDRICTALDDPDGILARDLASLSRRLQDVSREISQLGGEEEEDPVGDAATAEDENWGA